MNPHFPKFYPEQFDQCSLPSRTASDTEAAFPAVATATFLAKLGSTPIVHPRIPLTKTYAGITSSLMSHHCPCSCQQVRHQPVSLEQLNNLLSSVQIPRQLLLLLLHTSLITISSDITFSEFSVSAVFPLYLNLCQPISCFHYLFS